MLATVGTSAVVEPLDAKKRWVFKTTQNDDLIATALLKHMVAHGVHTVGFIGFSDPYGDNWLKVFGALGEKAGVRVIATERYGRTDASVTGQALKLIAAKPDAILIAAVGGPAVLPQATLRDSGYKGTIYQTHAVATDDFIKLGKDKVEGTVLAAGPMLVIDEIADSNPTKKVAQGYIAAYEKRFGSKPSTFGANTWDAGLLLERAIPIALKSGKPGTEAFRSALRDALESEKDVVGCQGVFNMSATNHNGMDERARVLVTIRGGRFRCCRSDAHRRHPARRRARIALRRRQAACAAGHARPRRPRGHAGRHRIGDPCRAGAHRGHRGPASRRRESRRGNARGGPGDDRMRECRRRHGRHARLRRVGRTRGRRLGRGAGRHALDRCLRRSRRSQLRWRQVRTSSRPLIGASAGIRWVSRAATATRCSHPRATPAHAS